MLKFDEDDRLAYIRHKEKLYLLSMQRWVWVLDYNKWNSYPSLAFSSTEVEELRFGIMVLDETSVDHFLDNAKPYIINIDDMKKFFQEKISKTNCYWDIEMILPKLYIDFDKRQLDAWYSFDDGPYWENYAPEHWQARILDFGMEYDETLLPLEQKYWYINGVNYPTTMETDCDEEGVADD